MDDLLTIAGKSYSSRLLVGTGKYKDFAQTREAIDASGAQIVTVAIRRTNIGQDPNAPSLLDALPPSQFTYLPNTAGCYTAEDAIRTLRLARELLDDHKLVKLEVLGDPHTLFPNMPETLKAAEVLVKEGFEVMVYCADDPIQARMLEDIGCVAVMPLASLIGSGMGILNPWNVQLIRNAESPAGAGRPLAGRVPAMWCPVIWRLPATGSGRHGRARNPGRSSGRQWAGPVRPVQRHHAPPQIRPAGR